MEFNPISGNPISDTESYIKLLKKNKAGTVHLNDVTVHCTVYSRPRKLGRFVVIFSVVKPPYFMQPRSRVKKIDAGLALAPAQYQIYDKRFDFKKRIHIHVNALSRQAIFSCRLFLRVSLFWYFNRNQA
jgi:hypothetical protein